MFFCTSFLCLNGQEVQWVPGVSSLSDSGQPQVPQALLQPALPCEEEHKMMLLFFIYMLNNKCGWLWIFFLCFQYQIKESGKLELVKSTNRHGMASRSSCSKVVFTFDSPITYQTRHLPVVIKVTAPPAQCALQIHVARFSCLFRHEMVITLVTTCYMLMITRLSVCRQNKLIIMIKKPLVVCKINIIHTELD